MEDARIARIEGKVDTLVVAMVKLTEHSIRLEGLVDHNVTQDKRLDHHSERIDTINISVIENTGASRMAERIFFVLFTASISFIAYSLRG